MNKVAEYKEVIYKEAMEKTAARAWKRDIGALSEEARERLQAAGVLNYAKEIAGLEKGTENIIARSGGVYDKTIGARRFKKQLRKISKPAGKGTVDALLRVFDKSRDDVMQNGNWAKRKLLLPLADWVGAAATRLANNQQRKIGKGFVTLPSYFSSLDPSATGIVVRGDLGRSSGLKGILLKKMGAGEVIDALDGKKLKSKQSLDYANAITRRHEADELRASRSIARRGLVDKDPGSHLPVSRMRVSSHVSPGVIVRESANTAVAPKDVREFMKTLRSTDANATGLDSLAQVYGKTGRNYGLSGKYDKEQTRKLEKRWAKINS